MRKRPVEPVAPDISGPPYLSLSKFAEAVGVTTRTVERWLVSGKLKPTHYTLGGHGRYSAKQVELIRASGGKPAEPDPKTPEAERAEAAAWVRSRLARRQLRATLAAIVVPKPEGDGANSRGGRAKPRDRG